MKSCYELAKKFKQKYPRTIAWRLKQHAKIIDKHLNPDEEILYLFVGQKNDGVTEIFNTYILAFTNKRVMIASKRVLFGYFFKAVTPDMYNDLTIHRGLLFGKVVIDTIKEVITITNLDPEALPEIETNISEIMIKIKREERQEEEKKEETKKEEKDKK